MYDISHKQVSLTAEPLTQTLKLRVKEKVNRVDTRVKKLQIEQQMFHFLVKAFSRKY